VNSFLYNKEIVYGYFTNDAGIRDSMIIEEINLDDKVYKPCKRFIFETKMYIDSDFALTDTFEIRVTGKKFFTKDLQKEIEYKYYNPELKSNQINRVLRKLNLEGSMDIVKTSTTGIKEREDQVWLHPARGNQYAINEFAPFPQVRFPLKIGNSWTETLSVIKYGIWENLSVYSEYKVTDTIKLNWKNNEPIECWKIEAQSDFDYREVKVNYYYNELLGFMLTEQDFFGQILTEYKLIDVIDL